MHENYGEFSFNGVHIDINKNVDDYDVAATTLHELNHQELAGNSFVGMLDFLLMNVYEVVNDEKIKSKIHQLYQRVSKSSIRVQEAVSMFQEFAFLKVNNTDKYNELMLHYKTETNYYKDFRFGELEFLLMGLESNEDAIDVSNKVQKIAISSMNINICDLNPLDGKYLHKMDKQQKEYNANYRFATVIRHIRETKFEVLHCDYEAIEKLFDYVDIPVTNFSWNRFKEWADNRLLNPLHLLSTENYVQFIENDNPINKVLSASAYNSSTAKYEYYPCNEKNEIENAFMNSQVLYIENNQDGSVRNLLVDYLNRNLYEFATRTVFIKWFNYVPIVFTDRKHYFNLVEIEPNIQNTWILVDLAEMSKNLIDFLKKVNVHEYYVLDLNEKFDAIFFKGNKRPLFFHLTTKINTGLWKDSYLRDYICRKTWWDDSFPIEGITAFKNYIKHQY